MSEPRPLAGRRILITRAAEQSVELRAHLEGRGAEVAVVPVLAFAPPTSWRAADEAIAHIGDYDALVFTSANAVDRFWSRVQDRVGHCDTPALPAKLYAVGPATAAALAAHGLSVENVPEEFRGEAIAGVVRGARRVLLPRAEAGREAVADALRAAGIGVDIAPVYRTVTPPGASAALRDALGRRVDALVLASPSAATHVVELLGGIEGTRTALKGALIAAIGPVTAARCGELGLIPSVVPARYTAADLAGALEAHFTSRRTGP